VPPDDVTGPYCVRCGAKLVSQLVPGYDATTGNRRTALGCDACRTAQIRESFAVLAFLTLLAVAALALLTAGCTRVSRVDPSTREEAASKITYVWEPTASLCFATLRSSTYYAYSVISISAVPAQACGR